MDRQYKLPIHKLNINKLNINKLNIDKYNNTKYRLYEFNTQIVVLDTNNNIVDIIDIMNKNDKIKFGKN